MGAYRPIDTVPRDPVRIYDMFPILKERSHRRRHAFRGEQQMLSIGGVDVLPKIMLLDEPSLGLPHGRPPDLRSDPGDQPGGMTVVLSSRTPGRPGLATTPMCWKMEELS